MVNIKLGKRWINKLSSIQISIIRMPGIITYSLFIFKKLNLPPNPDVTNDLSRMMFCVMLHFWTMTLELILWPVCTIRQCRSDQVWITNLFGPGAGMLGFYLYQDIFGVISSILPIDICWNKTPGPENIHSVSECKGDDPGIVTHAAS